MIKQNGLGSFKYERSRYKLKIDKDKEERRNNIVIKGIKREDENSLMNEDLKEWVKKLLKAKLEMECNLEYCR